MTNLTGASLKNADLEGANLSEANLEEAILTLDENAKRLFRNDNLLNAGVVQEKTVDGKATGSHRLELGVKNLTLQYNATPNSFLFIPDKLPVPGKNDKYVKIEFVEVGEFKLIDGEKTSIW